MPHTLVHLNNSALSHFIRGEYNHAAQELAVAYDLCLQRLARVSQTPSPLPAEPASTVSSTDSAGDDDSWVDDDDMMMEDLEDDVGLLVGESASSASTETRVIDPANLQQPLDESGSQLDSTERPSSTGAANGPSLPCCPTSASATCMLPTTAAAGNAFTMYNRALVLSLSDEEDESLFRTLAIILYNQALVQHNIGMHLGVSASLWHALKLYEQALETLDKHIPRQQQYDQTLPKAATLCWIWRIMDVEKLLLAILNNMGNIHAYLFHLENTNACMKSLRMILEASTSTSLLANAHATSSTSQMVMEEDYVFFLLNSLFQEKALCFAPAA